MNDIAIICVGPPGSGKTTWAKEFLKDHSRYRRVNMDDIGEMLGGGRGDINAAVVPMIAIFTAETIRTAGAIPLLDNTHCSQKSLILAAGRMFDLHFDVQVNVFETSIAECKRRNSERDRQVPEKVIDEMHAGLSKINWLHPTLAKCTIIAHKATDAPRHGGVSREQLESVMQSERLQEHL